MGRMITSTPEGDRAEALLKQDEALRAVTAAANERDRVVTAANEAVERAVIEAARIGASRNRIREEARVGPRVLYEWLTRAGLPVRPKRTAGET